MKTLLTEMLKVEFPIIMAPMFLVTNEKLMVAAYESKIAGCIPALNFKTIPELKSALASMRKKIKHGLGVNLIVNPSNVHLDKQLEVCLEVKVDFIITSLGGPKKIIDACKPLGIKVFCDVTDLNFAKKVEELGADAIIAVNSSAGGHAGPLPPSILIPLLKKHCKIPVISAGGVGNGAGLISAIALGAEGVSVGSPFIATVEADVSDAYKQAVVQYGAKDIVMTTKISGTPCSVIKTPYVEKIGTTQNIIERTLSKNKKIKKYAKMLTFYKGMKAFEKAAFGATYKTVWCAGPSIEFMTKIMTTKELVDQLLSGVNETKSRINAL